MRINIYDEEITNRMEVVRKSAEGRNFYGLRFNLLTHENMIPPKHPDDDTSAVTFWFDDRAKAHEFVCQAKSRLCDQLYPPKT